MPESVKEFDLVILGGGPGGYVAAIRAAQLGLQTCVIDEQPLGGVCVNWGCIPSKALLKAAETYQNLLHYAPELGLNLTVQGYDWQKVIQRSREVSNKNSAGVEYLVKRAKIHRIDGRFRINANRDIEILDKETKSQVTETVRGKHVIIATGSKNRNIPGIACDGERIITYHEAMILEKQPQHLIIIGAGAIGIEFAYFYASFGTKVTIIEMLPGILPIEDTDSSIMLSRSLKKLGMDIYVSTRVESVVRNGESVTVKTVNDSGANEFAGDACLVAIGFQANLENWGFENTGVALERGFIKVDSSYKTNIPGFYAIGDVIGPPQLAHVASHEGMICVEGIAGKNPHPLDYNTIPSCTYCQPQIASVGYTERKCKELGLSYKVGKFPFTASGKANAVGHTDGFVKLIFDEGSNKLLGAHIVGSEATEMIAELCIAKALGATAADLYGTIHAHPTLSESVMEAAAAAYGEAIHIFSR